MMAERSTSGLPMLSMLLEGVLDKKLVADIPVSGIRLDSRQVQPGDLFIAVNGTNTSGSEFIDDAIRHGAAAILVDTSAKPVASGVIPLYRVNNLQSIIGLIASRYYGHPSEDLYVTGITGTNGKTSVAWYLGQTLSGASNVPVGSIGTLGYGEFGKLVPANNTTPDAVTVQELLNRFRARRVRDVVMEVSSHALEQGRINNLLFRTAVFTNLTRDHLDYHGDMSAYAAAKKKLFMSAGLENAIINVDDEFGSQLINEFSGTLNIISYGLADNTARPRPDVEAILKEQTLASLVLDVSTPWGTGELLANLSGRFNAYNLMATLVVLCLRGIPFTTVLESLSTLRGVPGRMEYFRNKTSPAIFVDYAHTPDALQQALVSLRDQCKGKLICVFGCGGNRDQGKRPQMGHVAETWADRIILTNDNPRSESPEAIIHDIQSGMSGMVPVEIMTDRALAIQAAISNASSEDIVLLAGKGHETYQEIGTTRSPFSDRQMVRNLLGVME